MGDADGEGIDWDFWGAVMSDYEEVASTQRECTSVDPLHALTCYCSP